MTTTTKTPSRRAALGVLASIPALALPAAALVVSTPATATPAALAAQPPTAPAPTQEVEGLIEIGRRMPDLLGEFWSARSALNDAQARFNEIAPLPPKPRKRANDEAKPVFKIVRGTPSPLIALPREVSASSAYEALRDAIYRNESKFARKMIYQISYHFQRKFMRAAGDCGLADAMTRFRKASYELREVASQAFDFKPQTRSGIVAQALALYGAFEAKDGRTGSQFAASLAVSVLEVEASHGDMSAVLGPATPSPSARAAGQPV